MRLPPGLRSGTHIDRAMILASASIGIVQVAMNQVVRMVAVRNGLVAATGPVLVLLVVTAAIVLSNTRRGMAGIDRDHVLINMVGMQVVQMPVVKIVSVSFMLDSGVAAARTMFMWVGFVNTTLIGHSFPPSARISGLLHYLISPSSLEEMHPIGALLLRMPPTSPGIVHR